MKINVVTLCSGYDSQCLALERLKAEHPDFDYQLVAWAEFDPESKKCIDDQPAVKAHNALFPEAVGKNLGDITKVDWNSIDAPIDILFYSTPCQSISGAGLRQGFKEGSGTKSSVIWSVLNAIKALKPKYLLMENVSAMVGGKFKKDFNDWCDAVSNLGYNNYWDLLNAQDFGIPQHRKRVFMVSVRNDIQKAYSFPIPFPLTRSLSSFFERDVDKKYYYSCGKRDSFTEEYVSELLNGVGDSTRTIKAQYHKNNLRNFTNARSHSASAVIEYPRCLQVGNIYPDGVKFKNRTAGRVYSTEGLSPTVRTPSGGGVIPQFLMEDGTNYRIRRFTPRECFRMMGLNERSIDILQGIGLSDTQLYRLAGNSIVIDVLYYIVRNIYKDKEEGAIDAIDQKLF